MKIKNLFNLSKVNPNLKDFYFEKMNMTVIFYRSIHNYKEIFKKGHIPYSKHLDSNSSIENLTTLWLKQKRGVWLYNLHDKQIPKIKGKTDYSEIDISQLLSCDIVPWHTPKKNDLSRYLKQQSVIDFISKNQIDRIAELALEQKIGRAHV